MLGLKLLVLLLYFQILFITSAELLHVTLTDENLCHCWSSIWSTMFFSCSSNRAL